MIGALKMSLEGGLRQMSVGAEAVMVKFGEVVGMLAAGV